MGANTKIEWTDHTFNPWWGCTRISPACDHCYADTLARRYGHHVWDNGERRTFGDKHWAEPHKWARTMPEKLGRRPRVFCASMADVFDKDAPEGARERLWGLIAATPELDWLLLTKRIGNARSMLPPDWGNGYPNVWLGSTIANQEEADRDIPKLLALPAHIRFLSCEPLLGPIKIRPYTLTERPCFVCRIEDELKKPRGTDSHPINCGWRRDQRFADDVHARGIDWIISGGESGPKARPSHPDWHRSLRDQCAAAGAAFFMKQMGGVRDKRGALDDLPEDLRVREFPHA